MAAATSRGPFVLAGEALVDVVLPVEGPQVDAPGGSPLNVAVGLSRLGLDTLLVTELGDDAYGRLVRHHVESSGVRLDEGSVVPGHRTSSATAHLGADHAATYDFDLSWTLGPRTLPPDALGLHVGSIGAALRPGRDSVLGLLGQAVDAGVFVSFDPNARPAFLPPVAQAWADMTEVAGHADLVKMSDEDIHALAPDRSPAEVAAQLLGNGRTRLVVVTEGGGGALAYTAGTSVQVSSESISVTDTVGAGDSFMGALIAVTLDWGLDLDEPGLTHLLQAAHAVAAITCSRRGADPPRLDELPPGWPARA
ncbi:MAG: carbohydrate kinase [Nocardioides sp.]